MNALLASEELIKKYEGIGYFNPKPFFDKDEEAVVTLAELQDWLWEIENIFINVNLLQTSLFEFGYDILQRFKKGKYVLATKGDAVIKIASKRGFISSPLALADALDKAVELVKGGKE